MPWIFLIHGAPAAPAVTAHPWSQCRWCSSGSHDAPQEALLQRGVDLLFSHSLPWFLGRLSAINAGAHHFRVDSKAPSPVQWEGGSHNPPPDCQPMLHYYVAAYIANPLHPVTLDAVQSHVQLSNISLTVWQESRLHSRTQECPAHLLINPVSCSWNCKYKC